MYWPPAGGGGVPRPLKMATYLPELGIETHVLVPADAKRMHRDESLVPPPAAIVHETRNLAPRVHRPKEELARAQGAARLRLQAALTARRLLVPDPSSPWLLTAVPAAIRLVRRHGIDVVVTSSPPGSVNLLGAAVKRATGVRWVADLRDSLISDPHRRQDVRGESRVAQLVARRADAIVCVAPAAVEEMRALSPRGPVELIDHGADFDDFEGLEYTRGDRFRITHTGTIFGRRDPKPFLRALARLDDDVVARFVGDFREADRRVIGELGSKAGSSWSPTSAAGGARAPARFGGTPAPRAGGWGARTLRRDHEDLRVPRRGPADPRRRAGGRGRGGAPPRDPGRRHRAAG